MKEILSKEIYGIYIIQSDGRVFKKEYNTITKNGVLKKYKYKELKIQIRKGYKRVSLYLNKKNKNMTIHRLVALSFIPNPHNKPQVNHIDGNKLNNSISNLEGNTPKENVHHAGRIGLCDHRRKVVVA